MNIIKFCVIIAAINFLYTCGSSDKIIKRNVFIKGDFSYFLSDSSGNQLVSGILKVDYLKETKISGSYTVIKDPTVKFEGDETLKGGSFTGYYNDSLSFVQFNMNPKVADANIFISATDYTDSLKGSWYFSTFRGKKSGGLFSAKRIK